jgi:hypothetical protein
MQTGEDSSPFRELYERAEASGLQAEQAVATLGRPIPLKHSLRHLSFLSLSRRTVVLTPSTAASRRNLSASYSIFGAAVALAPSHPHLWQRKEIQMMSSWGNSINTRRLVTSCREAGRPRNTPFTGLSDASSLLRSHANSPARSASAFGASALNSLCGTFRYTHFVFVSSLAFLHHSLAAPSLYLTSAVS